MKWKIVALLQIIGWGLFGFHYLTNPDSHSWYYFFDYPFWFAGLICAFIPENKFKLKQKKDLKDERT